MEEGSLSTRRTRTKAKRCHKVQLSGGHVYLEHKMVRKPSEIKKTGEGGMEALQGGTREPTVLDDVQQGSAWNEVAL